jgi:VWFA-related protein
VARADSSRSLGARLVLFGCCLAAAAFSSAQTPARPGNYREEARVDRVVLDAFVTDNRGEPIPGLSAADFELQVDGEPVPLESAEWIPADTPEVQVSSSDETFAAEPPPNSPVAPGRLLIFFFQTDYTPTRLIGLMRMSLQARKLLDTLLPTDRVAVVSFDSHLKLRQDFTPDRAKILAGIHDALRTGRAAPLPAPPGPSLARWFDYRGALRAVTPERGLELIARAASSIPGGKSMLFFGWGLGTIGGVAGPNIRDIKDFAAALPALAKARITIFTLDVTDADYHSLEGTLSNIADLTGGTYSKTHIFPGLAIERVRRAIAGRYVLVFPKPAGRRGYHEVKVALASRKGHVQARTYYED